MKSINKAIVILSVLTQQTYSNSYYDELLTNGVTYSKNSISHYSKQDQSFVHHVMREGMPTVELRARYENEALEYVDFLLRLGNILTEEQRALVDTLLQQDYEEAAKADLLRTAFHLWREDNESGYKKLKYLIEMYDSEDFGLHFGVFAELYEKIYLLKGANIERDISGITEKNKSLDRFLNKYCALIEKSDVVGLKKDGRLKFDFSLQH